MTRRGLRPRATRSIAPRQERVAEVVVDSKVVEEDLPFRFVHYPSLYGIFIGFSQRHSDRPSFCDCSKQGIKNYLEFHNLANSNQLTISEQLVKDFPRTLTANSLKTEMFDQMFFFGSRLCHQCNHATPQVRYCHEMYGTRFKQYFGWYIGQMQYRLGFSGNSYLEMQSPREVQDLLKEFQSVNFPDLLKNDPANIFGKYLDACKTLTKLVENSTRGEFGFRRIGETWISESILFRQVLNMFPDKEILRHHRPVWLEGMEIDIFLPDMNLGIEYQGQQHFHPIKAWGGDEALEKLQQRDAKKKLLCEQHGILLTEFNYSDPLTHSFIREKLLQILGGRG